jgi:hypothetical protein
MPAITARENWPPADPRLHLPWPPQAAPPDGVYRDIELIDPLGMVWGISGGAVGSNMAV